MATLAIHDQIPSRAVETKFELQNPTHIVFGEGTIARLPQLIPPGTKVFLLYGGGSIMRNGVHAQVTAALEGYPLSEFGGIEVNPHYETIMRAAAQAKRERSEYILAVGGGSVIDAAKLLASAVTTDEADAWEAFFAGRYPRTILPVGCVLTLPATGSESNAVSVISSTERHLKYPFANEAARPAFAIMDPSTMASLDARQLSNGAVDAFTHVLEQYLTLPGNMPVQHGYSEVLLRTLIEWGPRLVADNSPEARETVMWAANQALNGLIVSKVFNTSAVWVVLTVCFVHRCVYVYFSMCVRLGSMPVRSIAIEFRKPILFIRRRSPNSVVWLTYSPVLCLDCLFTVESFGWPLCSRCFVHCRLMLRRRPAGMRIAVHSDVPGRAYLVRSLIAYDATVDEKVTDETEYMLAAAFPEVRLCAPLSFFPTFLKFGLCCSCVLKLVRSLCTACWRRTPSCALCGMTGRGSVLSSASCAPRCSSCSTHPPMSEEFKCMSK